MKKLVVTMLIATMAIASAGCSKAPEEPKTETTETTAKKEKQETDVTLEFLYNLNGEAISNEVQAVCEQFTEETGIGVEAIMPGSNFSDIMKTRMA